MLGVVLLVMVGEQVQEMQQAGWISTTAININMPDWLNAWFAVFPTVESLLAQYWRRRDCDRIIFHRAVRLQSPARWFVRHSAMYRSGL